MQLFKLTLGWIFILVFLLGGLLQAKNDIDQQNLKFIRQVLTAIKVGECGNSGNSSEAHIHYHLANSPIFH